MNARAKQDITLKMLDPEGGWNEDAVTVKAGEVVEFVYDEDNPDSLVINTSPIAGKQWLWSVEHYWFEAFDDLPTWEKLTEMLHENGFTFSVTFDSYRLDGDIDRPVMNLNFYDDGTAYNVNASVEDTRRAAKLVNQRWPGLSVVHAVDEYEMFVTVFPKAYTENVGKLLGDIREFLSSHRELVDDFIDTAGDEEDELVWGRIKNTIADLLNRIEKVQHNG